MKNKFSLFGLLFIAFGLFLFEHIQAIILYGIAPYFNNYWIDFILNLPYSIKSAINSQLTDLFFLAILILYIKKKNFVALILSILIYLLVYNRFISILFDLKNNYILLVPFLGFVILLIYYLKTYKLIFLVFILICFIVIYFDRDYNCNNAQINSTPEIAKSFGFIFTKCAGIYARLTSYLILIIHGLILYNATQQTRIAQAGH